MRLGDLDALKEAIKKTEYFNEYAFGFICDIIDNAPTVEEGPQLSDEQIEKITDLLEREWGYEGIKEDVSRILRGEEE